MARCSIKNNVIFNVMKVNVEVLLSVLDNFVTFANVNKYGYFVYFKAQLYQSNWQNSIIFLQSVDIDTYCTFYAVSVAGSVHFQGFEP